MRRLVLVSSLATLGFAIAEPVSAQHTYPPSGSQGVQRGVMPIDPDESDVRYPAGRNDPAIDSQALPPLTGRGTYPYDLHPRVGAPSEALPPPPDRHYTSPAPGYGEPAPGVSSPPPVHASPAPPAVYGAPPPVTHAPVTGPYGARPDDGTPRPPMSIEAGRPAYPGTTGSIPPTTIAALPPEDQPEIGKPKELPPQFRRQIVDYKTKHPAGTIIIDTPSTFLYYVNGDGTAIRYGIGVGREGFTWAGTEKITRMAEWPDWHPPAEMIERQPYLPRFMAGGESNPMGARALYLGKTIYRVHGTNQPSTIGQFVSSGCIRMLNEDVMDLYTRVKIGTKVVVIGDGKGQRASGATAAR